MLFSAIIFWRSAVDNKIATRIDQTLMRGVGFKAVSDDVRENYMLHFRDMLAAIITLNLPSRRKSISPKYHFSSSFFLFRRLPRGNARWGLQPTPCSSTGYQYSELLSFSCLFYGQVKPHDGSSGRG